MSTARGRAGHLTVVVDHDLCSGVGQCQDVAPEMFRVRDGRSWPHPSADSPPERLLAAETQCPWFAISLEPDPDPEPAPAPAPD